MTAVEDRLGRRWRTAGVLGLATMVVAPLWSLAAVLFAAAVAEAANPLAGPNVGALAGGVLFAVLPVEVWFWILLRVVDYAATSFANGGDGGG